MAKARGDIERKRKLEKLPYIVECPRRGGGGGVWREFDDLEAWARRTCGNDGYVTTSREVRRGPAMPKYILCVHFAVEAKARAFAREFGLSYP
jgi:hypothetical protein